MNEVQFKRWRWLYCILIGMLFSGVSCLPVIFLPIGWVGKFVTYAVIALVYGVVSQPFVSRLMVEDKRFYPALRPGVSVYVDRVPYDFETEELQDIFPDDIFFFDEVNGVIASRDGPLVWIEFEYGYFGTHVNCLDVMPSNIVPYPFRADDSADVAYEIDE